MNNSKFKMRCAQNSVEDIQRCTKFIQGFFHMLVEIAKCEFSAGLFAL